MIILNSLITHLNTYYLLDIHPEFVNNSVIYQKVTKNVLTFIKATNNLKDSTS